VLNAGVRVISYRKFKGLRPLRLHVVSVKLGFKSLTPTVFNFEVSSSVLKIIAMARQEAGGRRQEAGGKRV
jgi:hypothetical protein